MQSGAVKDFFILIGNYMGLDGIWDILFFAIDISLVSYVFYKIFHLVRETRAMQLVKGIVFILIASKLSEVIGLRTLAFILQNTIQLLGFALIVVFQPEIRRGLEKVGRSGFKNFVVFDDSTEDLRVTTVIEEIVKACEYLAGEFIGALIVFEKDTKIGEVINTGTKLEANVSAELLSNIFTPNTPLHDGAVIVREDKIMAAGCFLPLSENANLSSDLGTRHRAALGITEVSDSIAIVVSEESGRISYASNGNLTRNLTIDMLRKALSHKLTNKSSEKRKIAIWRKHK